MESQRLQDLVFDRAARAADDTALWWRGRATTYADLANRVRQVAGRLASRGYPGERIAVLAWNCPEFVELIYAVPASGRVLVPLNARLAPAEWLYQLRAAGVSLLVAEPDLLRALRAQTDYDGELESLELGAPWEEWLERPGLGALPATAVDDPAWILYTSGSTGRPKGAVLSHGSFLAALRSAALARPVRATDRYFYPFPLFHVAAHNVLLQHCYGAAVILVPRFDAEQTLQACRELGVTSMSLAPTMIGMLLDHPDYRPGDLAGVRSIGYGASAMPQTLLRRLLGETGVELCQSYGMTELAGSVSFLTAADHRAAAAGREELLRSVGRPLPTAELQVVDDAGHSLPAGQAGEILVRAEQVMLGYWEDAAATEAALRGGWLHTGDVGRFDEEGYLYIVDRKKDMVISGGENVASREVEEVLRQHPAVRDCAVVGVPDAQWGEAVTAVIVAREPGKLEAGLLRAHCRQQLAGYKCPRRFLEINELPLNAAGKVDKPGLRRRVAGA